MSHRKPALFSAIALMALGSADPTEEARSRSLAIRAALLGNAAILDDEVATKLGFHRDDRRRAGDLIESESKRLREEKGHIRFDSPEGEAMFVRRFWSQNAALVRLWTVEQVNRYERLTGLSR